MQGGNLLRSSFEAVGSGASDSFVQDCSPFPEEEQQGTRRRHPIAPMTDVDLSLFPPGSPNSAAVSLSDGNGSQDKLWKERYNMFILVLLCTYHPGKLIARLTSHTFMSKI